MDYRSPIQLRHIPIVSNRYEIQAARFAGLALAGVNPDHSPKFAGSIEQFHLYNRTREHLQKYGTFPTYA